MAELMEGNGGIGDFGSIAFMKFEFCLPASAKPCPRR
jgi:hypothetical protein